MRLESTSLVRTESLDPLNTYTKNLCANFPSKCDCLNLTFSSKPLITGILALYFYSPSQNSCDNITSSILSITGLSLTGLTLTLSVGYVFCSYKSRKDHDGYYFRRWLLITGTSTIAGFTLNMIAISKSPLNLDC